MCLETYNLDPVHYVSSPSMAFDGMLKISEIELDFLDSMEKVEFLEGGIRGGISVVSHRFARANNEYMENYDPLKPKKYLIYLDANSLYSTAMLYKLPARNFRFLNKEEISNFEIMTKSKDDKIGYILEVDLQYPPSIHDTTGEYPLAPEKIHITDEQLSSLSRELKEKLNLKTNKTLKKLVPNVNDKFNYTLHYLNLKYYLERGMILKKFIGYCNLTKNFG